MIKFTRYPHVEDLLKYYAETLNLPAIQKILNTGVSNREEAFELSRFIWSMADAMADDAELKITVLGRIDNSDILPDVDYEISVYLEELGYRDVWEQVSDEA